MKLRVPVIVGCAILGGACGGSDAASSAKSASASPSATATGPSGPAPHIVEANEICIAAQPSFGRAEARIERAADALEAGAKGAERRRHLSRSRAGWMARHDTMATLFTQLRDLQKVGADKSYDTFLASWGKTLSTVESVAENTGGDQEELETSFGALRVYADELADAMVDANVAFCDPFMPQEERENLDG